MVLGKASEKKGVVVRRGKALKEGFEGRPSRRNLSGDLQGGI